MARLYLVFLLLLATTAAAQVYKWVDAEGRTQFSDRPRPDAQAVGKPKTLAESSRTPDQQGATASTLGPYSAFEIVTPEANQVLRQTEGPILVSLLLVPELQSNHHLEITLNGASVPVERAFGTQLSLSGVGFGSHQAQARVVDPQGAVIATTPLITFHLRKPIPPGVLP